MYHEIGLFNKRTRSYAKKATPHSCASGVLYGNKHIGAHFNDLEICNNAGLYKGGISKLQDQLNNLYSSKNEQAPEINIESDVVSVYPNPTNSSFFIN